MARFTIIKELNIILHFAFVMTLWVIEILDGHVKLSKDKKNKFKGTLNYFTEKNYL